MSAATPRPSKRPRTSSRKPRQTDRVFANDDDESIANDAARTSELDDAETSEPRPTVTEEIVASEPSSKRSKGASTLDAREIDATTSSFDRETFGSVAKLDPKTARSLGDGSSVFDEPTDETTSSTTNGESTEITFPTMTTTDDGPARFTIPMPTETQPSMTTTSSEPTESREFPTNTNPEVSRLSNSSSEIARPKTETPKSDAISGSSGSSSEAKTETPKSDAISGSSGSSSEAKTDDASRSKPVESQRSAANPETESAKIEPQQSTANPETASLESQQSTVNSKTASLESQQSTVNPETESAKIESQQQQQPSNANAETESPKTANPEVELLNAASPKTEPPKTADPKTEPPKIAPKSANPTIGSQNGANPETESRNGASPETESRNGASPETESRNGASPETESRNGASPETESRNGANPETESRKSASQGVDGDDASSPNRDSTTSARKSAAINDDNDDDQRSARVQRGGFAVGFKTFKEFMSDFAKHVNVGKSVEETRTLMKSVNSGVKSFDDLVANLPVRQNRNGVLSIADTTAGYVRKLAREGDLPGLAKLSKTTVPILESDKRAFSALAGVTPEKSLRQIADSAEASKSLHPGLNATAADIDKLSATAKQDVKKIEGNLMKCFKQGSVIALTIGAVYVGVDWLSKATEARQGCYMLTTINNKTTSCKVAAYSCSNPTTGNLCAGAAPAYYNTTLVLMTIAQLPDTDQRKLDLAKALNMNAPDVATSLKTIVDTKFQEVNDYVSRLTTKPTVNVCEVKSSLLENGIVPVCRMCSPSDNPTSTTFVDPAQYADNITFQCVSNPSILDTVADAVASTGVDLWEGIKRTFNFPIKSITIALACIVVLLLFVWLVVKFVFSRKSGGGGG